MNEHNPSPPQNVQNTHSAQNTGSGSSKPLSDQKKELRSYTRLSLAAFKESPQYEQYSLDAMNHFLESPLYRYAPLILTFVSAGTEINTHPLLIKMLEDKKRVAIPETTENSMTFRMLSPDIPLSKQMRRGNFDIEEPVKSLEPVKPETLPAGTVILVPGLAFSEDGARLGKGKGYYDRYIEQVPVETVLVGYAFQLQIAETVPCEDHDKKVDYLVTEEKMIICGM